MTPAIPEPKPSAEALLQAIELIDQASSALDLPVRHTSPEQEAENHRIARRLLDVSSMLRAELSASAPANAPAATGDAVRASAKGKFCPQCVAIAEQHFDLVAKLDAVRALVAEWRNGGKGSDEWSRGYWRACSDRADELEAALSADKASGEVGR